MRVALLQFAVRVDGHGADGGLPPELDVDEVRQLAVALPAAAPVPPGLAAGQGPGGRPAHLSPARPPVTAATPRVGTGEIFHHC